MLPASAISLLGDPTDSGQSAGALPLVDLTPEVDPKKLTEASQKHLKALQWLEYAVNQFRSNGFDATPETVFMVVLLGTTEEDLIDLGNKLHFTKEYKPTADGMTPFDVGWHATMQSRVQEAPPPEAMNYLSLMLRETYVGAKYFSVSSGKDRHPFGEVPSDLDMGRDITRLSKLMANVFNVEQVILEAALSVKTDPEGVPERLAQALTNPLLVVNPFEIVPTKWGEDGKRVWLDGSNGGPYKIPQDLLVRIGNRDLFNGAMRGEAFKAATLGSPSIALNATAVGLLAGLPSSRGHVLGGWGLLGAALPYILQESIWLPSNRAYLSSAGSDYGKDFREAFPRYLDESKASLAALRQVVLPIQESWAASRGLEWSRREYLASAARATAIQAIWTPLEKAARSRVTTGAAPGDILRIWDTGVARKILDQAEASIKVDEDNLIYEARRVEEERLAEEARRAEEARLAEEARKAAEEETRKRVAEEALQRNANAAAQNEQDAQNVTPGLIEEAKAAHFAVDGTFLALRGHGGVANLFMTQMRAVQTKWTAYREAAFQSLPEGVTAEDWSAPWDRAWQAVGRAVSAFELEHAAELRKAQEDSDTAHERAEEEEEVQLREIMYSEAEKFRSPPGAPPTKAELDAQDFWARYIQLEAIDDYGPKRVAQEALDIEWQAQRRQALEATSPELREITRQQWDAALIYIGKDFRAQLQAAEQARVARLAEVEKRRSNPEAWRAEKEAAYQAIRERVAIYQPPYWRPEYGSYWGSLVRELLSLVRSNIANKGNLAPYGVPAFAQDRYFLEHDFQLVHKVLRNPEMPQYDPATNLRKVFRDEALFQDALPEDARINYLYSPKLYREGSGFNLGQIMGLMMNSLVTRGKGDFSSSLGPVVGGYLDRFQNVMRRLADPNEKEFLQKFIKSINVIGALTLVATGAYVAGPAIGSVLQPLVDAAPAIIAARVTQLRDKLLRKTQKEQERQQQISSAFEAQRTQRLTLASASSKAMLDTENSKLGTLQQLEQDQITKTQGSLLLRNPKVADWILTNFAGLAT